MNFKQFLHEETTRYSITKELSKSFREFTTWFRSNVDTKDGAKIESDLRKNMEGFIDDLDLETTKKGVIPGDDSLELVTKILTPYLNKHKDKLIKEYGRLKPNEDPNDILDAGIVLNFRQR